VRELSAKTHTASLIASDLKGTEEPDGAFGGGSYPSVRESPVMMALRNQSLPTTVTSFFRRVSVTLIMGAPGTSLRVGRARCVLWIEAPAAAAILDEPVSAEWSMNMCTPRRTLPPVFACAGTRAAFDDAPGRVSCKGRFIPLLSMGSGADEDSAGNTE
jgi:hypothetical protein